MGKYILLTTRTKKIDAKNDLAKAKSKGFKKAKILVKHNKILNIKEYQVWFDPKS
jgi:hypothetical protein